MGGVAPLRRPLRAAFSLRALHARGVSPADVQVEVRTRDGLLGGQPALPNAAETPRRPFRVEVR